MQWREIFPPRIRGARASSETSIARSNDALEKAIVRVPPVQSIGPRESGIEHVVFGTTLYSANLTITSRWTPRQFRNPIAYWNAAESRFLESGRLVEGAAGVGIRLDFGLSHWEPGSATVPCHLRGCRRTCGLVVFGGGVKNQGKCVTIGGGEIAIARPMRQGWTRHFLDRCALGNSPAFARSRTGRQGLNKGLLGGTIGDGDTSFVLVLPTASRALPHAPRTVRAAFFSAFIGGHMYAP